MQIIEQAAQTELNEILNAHPAFAPVLIRQLEAGEIREDCWIYEGHGSLYGALAAFLLPAEAEEEEIELKAARLSRKVRNRLSLPLITPLQRFMAPLFPVSFETPPPFYSSDHPAVRTLLRWVTERKS